MQISRSLMVACAAACATTLVVRGNDTPAQIKAREALRQKLGDTTQADSTASSVSTPMQRADSDAIAKAREVLRQKIQENAPVAPMPAASAPAPVAAPATANVAIPAAAPADSDAIAKAREALRQKIQENTPPPATPPLTAPVPAVAPTPAPAPAVVATPTPAAPAADSDAINKAREAVRRQLEQQPPAVAAQPAPAPKVVPPVAAAPAPSAPPPAAAPVAPAAKLETPVPPPAQVAQSSDPESIQKARDAMRQKIQESGTSLPAPRAPLTFNPVPASAPAAPPRIVVPPIETSPAATAQAGETDALAKAREAVRQRINEDNEVGPKADPETIAKAREAVRQRVQSINYADAASNPSGRAALNFPPLEGPPLPISSEKHQRLNELLQRYRADQLTPEQYQAERAKILAGP